MASLDHVALESFNRGGAVLRCVVVGEAWPRCKVASLDGLEPGLADGEAGASVEVTDQCTNAGEVVRAVRRQRCGGRIGCV